MNKPYMMKPDVNVMPPAAKNWLILATSGVYGPKGRLAAALLAATNPDYAGLIPQVTDVPAPDYSAERQRDEMAVLKSKASIDGVIDKSQKETEKRSSSGDKYSGKGYNTGRYQDSAYADKSKQKHSRVYSAAELFRKMSDALKRLRSIYQRSGNNEDGLITSEYDPLRNNTKPKVFNFADYKRRMASNTTNIVQQSGTIDDTLEDAA